MARPVLMPKEHMAFFNKKTLEFMKYDHENHEISLWADDFLYIATGVCPCNQLTMQQISDINDLCSDEDKIAFYTMKMEFENDQCIQP